jgi:hypothetical protein
MLDRRRPEKAGEIALGHTADGLCYCLGEVREPSATIALRQKFFTIADTGMWPTRSLGNDSVDEPLSCEPEPISGRPSGRPRRQPRMRE